MLRIVEPELDKLLQFFSQNDDFVFLDTSRPDSENSQSLLFLNAEERLVCRAGESLEDYLASLQEKLSQGYYLAGWIGYEFGALLEGGVQKNRSELLRSEMVLADLGVFKKPYKFDHSTGVNNFPLDGEQLESFAGKTCRIHDLHSNMDKEDFLSSLKNVQDYIAAGDTYQVNYTMKLLFELEGSVEKLYSLLRKNQSVGYGSFLSSGKEKILSFSPELFFRKRGTEITAKPMKGTLQRGRNLSEEQQNSCFLQNDSKNRSENVMIVDLLRNDLARLVHGHGHSRVFVESLFDIESYESLLQMTSTVKATADAESMRNLPLTEIFKALFPCGSITGAPKIRTMQIIDELEKDRRGVYTGAIGFFGPEGSAAFCVPIRTVKIVDGKGEMGIGGGITHDSKPEDEWDEALLKGRFLTHSAPDFFLFETMLHSKEDGYFLLEEHLQRLQTAASYFKFSYNIEAVRKKLLEDALEYKSPCSRVRLVLKKDGRIAIEANECDSPAAMELPSLSSGITEETPYEIDFSTQKVDTATPWVFFKTTNRALYNEEHARALEDGLFDCLFCNDKGSVTEGCITNVIINSRGQYKTPPVDSGLLPGVMREKLLCSDSVSVIEEQLTVRDIQQAEAIYLCNSVRGVVQVKLRKK